MSDPDVQFFFRNPTRRSHIRLPRKELFQDKQRAVSCLDECELEFRSLGDHEKNRRRILLFRVPPDNPMYDPERPQILKIPFLLYSDETVEDTDEILLPVIEQIMRDALESVIH